MSRKITLAAARIKKGIQRKLYLGNLDSKRDWGYAKDYVKSMWLMLQNNMPEDFVIASGEQHSVREFVELAFSFISIKIKWIGKGVQEKGIDEKSGNTIIEIDPKYYRPTEVDSLLGDPTKAEKKLGWNPKETSFKKLVKIMIKHDIKLVENEIRIKQSYE